MEITLRALESDAGDAKDASHFWLGPALPAEFGRFGLPVVSAASAKLRLAGSFGAADDASSSAAGTRSAADSLPGDLSGRREQLPAARFGRRQRRQQPQRR